MRGSVIKRGATWSVVVDAGRDAAGRRVRKWHSGYGTRREAEAARIDLLARMQTGTYIEPNRLTFGDFLRREWLPGIRSTVRPTTFDSYTRMVEGHLLPHLGAVPLRQLSAPHLNGLYGELLVSGRKDGRGGLSTRTVHYCHVVAHRALADGVRWGRLPRNPADMADPPRETRPERSVWTPEQLRRFLGHVHDDRLFAFYQLLVTTGLRRGETLGLRWADVELERGRLAVRRSLVCVGYKLAFSEPKTARSRRVVALDAATVGVLQAHRVRQLEERLAVGPGYTDSDLVFATVDGLPLHPQSVAGAFDRHVRASGLPRLTLHGLRHSYATAALMAGVETKLVSERLGHSSTAITSDVYTHVPVGMQDDAARRVAALILEG